MSKQHPVPYNTHDWSKGDEHSGQAFRVHVKPDYDALASGYDRPSGIVKITYRAFVDLMEMAGYTPDGSTIEAERGRYSE